MDDGARVTVFNSKYPQGVVDQNAFAYLGQKKTNSFSQYLVDGRNRLVVTQVDDCQVENNIVATVSLNGNTLDVPTCTRCNIGYNLNNGVCVPSGGYYTYNNANDNSEASGEKPHAATDTTTVTNSDGTTTTVSTSTSDSSKALTIVIGVFAGIVVVLLVAIVVVLVTRSGAAETV
jgi:hypothetical protein